MNTSYFVLMSILLTFATGFFVATIIWGISWFLSPKEERMFAEWFSGIFRNEANNMRSGEPTAQSKDADVEDSEYNLELYHYHHGEN